MRGASRGARVELSREFSPTEHLSDNMNSSFSGLQWPSNPIRAPCLMSMPLGFRFKLLRTAATRFRILYSISEPHRLGIALRPVTFELDRRHSVQPGMHFDSQNCKMLKLHGTLRSSEGPLKRFIFELQLVALALHCQHSISHSDEFTLHQLKSILQTVCLHGGRS